MIAGQEARDADGLALQGVRIQRRGIVLLARICLCRCWVARIGAGNHGEHQRGVGHRERHRPGRVLRRADRHDEGAGDQAHCGLEADNSVGGGGADDRSICLRADRPGGKARRHGGAGARGGAAGVAVEHVRVAGLAADGAPARRRVVRPEIGPLAEVGLAQDHGAGRPQPRRQRRIAAGDIVLQRQ